MTDDRLAFAAQILAEFDRWHTDQSHEDCMRYLRARMLKALAERVPEGDDAALVRLAEALDAGQHKDRS